MINAVLLILTKPCTIPVKELKKIVLYELDVEVQNSKTSSVVV